MTAAVQITSSTFEPAVRLLTSNPASVAEEYGVARDLEALRRRHPGFAKDGLRCKTARGQPAVVVSLGQPLAFGAEGSGPRIRSDLCVSKNIVS